jgi:PAS domain S-box-containing protein
VDEQQAALREAGETVREAAGAILLFDGNREVVAASESCAVVFERDPESLVGESLSDLADAGYLDDSVCESFDEAVTAFQDGGESETFEVSVRPGGSQEQLLYSGTVSLVRDGEDGEPPSAEESDGEVVGSQFSLAAVGTRERYEETLESLHRATRGLMTANSELAVYDHVGRAANDILGIPGTGVRKYDPEEEVLRHVAFGNDVTVIDSRPPYDVADSPHGQAFIDGEPLEEEIGSDDDFDREVFSHVLYVPIGEYGVLSLGKVGGPFEDTDRRFAEILTENAVAALKEVRNREQLEAQRADLKRYETIVETVPDPVYATDAAGQVTFANRAFEEYFGVERDRLDGLDFVELTTNEDSEAISDELARLRDGDSSGRTSVDIVGFNRDGRRRRLDASIAVLPSDEADGTAGVLRDVTERKRRQEVLTVMNRALRHNLRTNVNTILAHANALAPDPEGEREDYLLRIEEAAGWLVKLGDTLRTLQPAILEQSDEDVTIDTLVDNVADRYRADNPDASIDVDVGVTGRLAGGYSLQYALDNVIENAIVHNDTPTPHVSVSVREADRDGWIDVSVADDGPGIPQTEREVVVGDAEISTLQHGSGIGLWTTRWIVQAFDGEIEIADNDPRGTVVTLRLRRVDTD